MLNAIQLGGKRESLTKWKQLLVALPNRSEKSIHQTLVTKPEWPLIKLLQRTLAILDQSPPTRSDTFSKPALQVLVMTIPKVMSRQWKTMLMPKNLPLKVWLTQMSSNWLQLEPITLDLLTLIQLKEESPGHFTAMVLKPSPPESPPPSQPTSPSPEDLLDMINHTLNQENFNRRSPRAFLFLWFPLYFQFLHRFSQFHILIHIFWIILRF